MAFNGYEKFIPYFVLSIMHSKKPSDEIRILIFVDQTGSFKRVKEWINRHPDLLKMVEFRDIPNFDHLRYFI